jgi:hypothetical protein
MSNTELKCYKQRYPNDLSNLTDSELQKNWDTQGVKQGRYNKCSALQTTPGLYEYKGCYNHDYRALLNLRSKNSSIDQCSSIAKRYNETLFGMQYYGECWTGNDEFRVFKFGENLGNCGIMGRTYTQNVYKRIKPFPPPSSSYTKIKKTRFF